MKKIKVPEGMIEAAHKASEFTDYEREKRTLRFAPGIINTILEAALLWLTEHPIVPTMAQIEAIRCTGHPCILDGAWYAQEWQRRMFLEPEPEVPEEIKDMLLDAHAPDSEHCFFKPSVYNERITEAYRRGKESRKP